MERLSRDGAQYRTKLMTLDQANRFARCLGANTRFAGVVVEESSRAKHPTRRWLVAFTPASEERQAVLLDRQQTSREERAFAEGSEYVWVLDEDGGRPFFWLFSTSGEVYEVDRYGYTCSCPDYHYRCRPTGLRCKHLIALENGLGAVRRW